MQLVNNECSLLGPDMRIIHMHSDLIKLVTLSSRVMSQSLFCMRKKRSSRVL